MRAIIAFSHWHQRWRKAVPVDKTTHINMLKCYVTEQRLSLAALLAIPDTQSVICLFEPNLVPLREENSKMIERPFILVIEDQYLLLADVLQALGECGFEADAVSSGEEALELFANGAKTYKALITDVRLDGSLTGWEVARRIRQSDPTFPVIYLTASAVDEWVSEAVPNSILIAKPYTSTQLASALSRLPTANIEASVLTRTVRAQISS